MNTQKIKKRMRECGFTQNQIAAQLNLASSTLNQKIHNKRPTKLGEAELIAKLLNIKNDDFASYFFKTEGG